MKILGIETSCDDTGIAILEVKQNKKGQCPEFSVLANVVASQIEAHKPYGGVYPFLAKREHIKNLPITFKKALKKAKITDLGKEIDLIAATNGPGLEPCLWAGVNFAQELSKKYNLPIISVNHIEGHILVNALDSTNYKLLTTNLPAVALVVSGGHTQLILVQGIGKYKIIGETRDDAAGECFDKCAKMLGLGYPGGPAIAKIASQLLTTNYSLQTKLPRPMINTKDYDFSFSGLKTAVLYAHKKQEQAWHNLDDRPKFATAKKQYIIEMAVEIQQAIIDVLLKKTFKAVKDFNARTIILGGGVSANQELRKQFQEACNRHCEGEARSNLNLVFPPTNLSTDNGLMIAVAGYFNKNRIINCKDLKADSNLRIGE